MFNNYSSSFCSTISSKHTSNDFHNICATMIKLQFTKRFFDFLAFFALAFFAFLTLQSVAAKRGWHHVETNTCCFTISNSTGCAAGQFCVTGIDCMAQWYSTTGRSICSRSCQVLPGSLPLLTITMMLNLGVNFVHSPSDTNTWIRTTDASGLRCTMHCTSFTQHIHCQALIGFTIRWFS